MNKSPHSRPLVSLFVTLAACAAALIPTSASAAPRKTEVPPLLRNVHRIVTLGDSITQGGGKPGGYVWMIDQFLQVLYPDQKIEVINAGISGHKSSDMLDRFQRDVLDKRPDLVTISVGINDVWHGFTPEHPLGYGPRRVAPDAYKLNVSRMLQAAKQAGVKVVLFTTTIFEDEPGSIRNVRIAGYNDLLRELAGIYGATLADQYAAFMATWAKNGNSGAKLTSDQVHLAPSGDALMARTALRAFGIPEGDLARANAEVLKRMPGHR
jgi:lysophospholipase L1-like esterase